MLTFYLLTYLLIKVPRNKKTVCLGSIISSATVVGVRGHAELESEEESLKVLVQVNERNLYFVGISSQDLCFKLREISKLTYYKYHFNLLNAIGDIYLSVFLHIFRSSVSFFLIMLHRYFIVLNLHKQSIRNNFNSFSFNDGILCIFLFTGTCKIERNCTSTLNVC